MEITYNYDDLDLAVGKILKIEDRTFGTTQQKFIVRYRGQLLNEDTIAAYDQLAEALKSSGLTPLFRWDEDRHAVILVPGMPEPKKSNPYVNLVLFIITLISVILSGALYSMDQPLPAGFLPMLLAILKNGWPFAISMIAILGSHEFGHYLAGRYHGVHVTLPYFIPFPFSPFGTMGAFINMKESPKNKRDLLDIGVAGPLSGFMVTIPILLLGLKLSRLDVLPMSLPQGISFSMEGNSILYLLLKYISFGKWIPAPLSYGDVSPILYWLRYFFTGQPFPLGGTDVMISPVAWAGWAGLLVTSLNLIPAGQLDGGHIMYVLLGRKKAKKLWPIIVAALVLMGLAWSGWWLWAGLIFLLGRTYAEPLDQITELNPGRKRLALLTLIVFFLAFSPVPLVYF